MPQPVTIIADDREIGSGVCDALMRQDKVSVHIQRLSVGDYVVDKRLAFERKTLHDFAISVVDGRLFRQSMKIASGSMMPVLILEGTGQDVARTNVRREALQGALITVSLILGVAVLRSRDSGETAQLIVTTARQLATVARGAIQRHAYRPKGRRRCQLYILQGLPGIGPELAERLLDHFGSIAAVASATPDQLLAVQGIGLKTAERIKWATD